jgi:3-methyladenine DNA glycosylase AlkC
MKKSFSLKDHLFNKESVTYLSELFWRSDPSFKKEEFIAQVMTKLNKLELKERIVWIAEVLEDHLSKDFKKASKQIQKALPAPLDPLKTDDDFGSFIFAPLGEYVVRNGLSKEHLELSLLTIHELTQRFSMEDAIRYFINAYPKETLQALKEWSRHEHYHVRRLVSEGTRPLLPWSGRISLEVTQPVPFLDALHADGTRYVTRSVANHLNDISKKHPKLVVDLLAKWKKEGKQDLKELQWMTRHALRTLVKQGNKEALSLLGYAHDPKIKVEQFSVKPSSKKIAPGEVLSFSFTITALENTELMVDYIIDFVKAKGGTKPKVFKIKKVRLKKGESVSIMKNHRLLADATTFVLHLGKHTVTLQINGKKFDSADFVIR